MNVNISKIAELAGVGKATVSRVLNNKPNVSPETAEKVRKVCEEFNYTPNFFASNIMNVQTNIIGLFLEADNENYYKYYGDLLEGCIVEARRFGMQILPYFSPDVNLLHEILTPGKSPLAGALILAPSVQENRLVQLEKYKIPYVIIGALYRETKEYSSVDINNRKLVYDSLDYLYQKGFRNIGFINSLPQLTISMEREKSVRMFEKTHTDVHIAKRACADQEGVVAEVIESLLRENKEISTFLVASDIIAKGIYDYFSNQGKVIGKDISVLALGGIKYAQTLIPKLTCAVQDYVAIGKAAVQMLKQRIDGVCAEKHKFFESYIEEGESVADQQ